MNPTPEQTEVIKTDLKAGDALKVVAFAGTGKTSTFVEYAKARPMDQMLYLAFNKSVQQEAEGKFPANVMSRTVHSMAYQSIGKQFKNLGNVPFFLVTKLLSVDVYRATLIMRTLENWHNSADDHIEEKHVPPDSLGRFERGFEPKIVDGADYLWRQMRRNDDKMPMTHSGYLKLYQLSKPRLGFDLIMLDEAQDTNPVTFDIIRQQRELGCRILVCGDPYQQIYSWRGAQDALDMIDCPTLYLTQSFRFGPAVASVANKLLSTFFSNKVPLRGHDIADSLVDRHADKHTVICRTNQALFRTAASCAAAKQCIAIVGNVAFDQYLDKLMDVYYLFAGRRTDICERQVAFFKSYADLVKFAADRLDVELGSRVNIVNDFGDRTPAAIASIRSAIVPASQADVLLVTGHKAKGLEWDSVSLSDDFAELFDDQRRPFAVGPDSLPKDEVNLLYVSCTRAKRNLQLNSELRSLMSWAAENYENSKV